MAHHQFFEWGSRRFDGDNPMPVADAERLIRAARAQEARLTGSQRAFDFQRHAFSARNLVGLVSAGDTSCEILPKIDRDAPGEVEMLRLQLVRMLGAAHDVPIADDGPAATGAQRDTLLEFLIGRFAGMLEIEMRRGIPRAYVEHADDLPALRGQLNVTRQFSTLAARSHQLACRYDEFSEDIPINQAVKAAVAWLYKVSRSLANRRRLGELALVYADVSVVPPSRIPWHKVSTARGTSSWMPVIRFAKLLLGEQFQNTAHGQDEGFSLLFDMNVLFERYTERLLRPMVIERGFQLRSQGGGRPCLLAEDTGAGLFATYPDLRVCRGEEVEWIIDTKWKRLSDRAGSAKMDVDQADVYQMMAYAQIYGCARLVLLYPYHAGLSSSDPVRHYVANSGGGVRLTIATVDVRSHARARASLKVLLDAENAG